MIASYVLVGSFRSQLALNFVGTCAILVAADFIATAHCDDVDVGAGSRVVPRSMARRDTGNGQTPAADYSLIGEYVICTSMPPLVSAEGGNGLGPRFAPVA